MRNSLAFARSLCCKIAAGKVPAPSPSIRPPALFQKSVGSAAVEISAAGFHAQESFKQSLSGVGSLGARVWRE